MSKSVLITGATGNIGSAITQEMIQQGYQVFALCQSQKSMQRALQSGCQVITGNLQQPHLWVEALDKVDGVIHTACTFDENMGLTDLKLLKSVWLRVQHRTNPLFKFVYTTGCWVHGSHHNIINEKTPEEPVKDFAWMKANRNWLFSAENIQACAVSPANVVSQANNYVPDILHTDYANNGKLRIPGKINDHLSLVSLESLARLYRLAYECGKQGETYIGVSDPKVAFSQMAIRLEPNLFNCQSQIIENSLSDWIEEYGSWTEGYGLTQVFSSDKAIQQLGWQPQPVYNKK